VRVIRAYAQEEAELRQFERLNRDYIAQNLSLAPRIEHVYAAPPDPDRRHVF